jgi:PAS domain-containing protein
MAAIVESSDDTIVGKSLEGVVTSWKEAAEQIFGHTAPEMVGQPISVLSPPGRADEMRIIGLGRVVTGQRKDGSIFPTEPAVGESAANAFWHCFEAPRVGEVYTSAAGVTAIVSMLEAIEKCQTLTGREMRRSYDEANRAGDHIWWISDIRRFPTHYTGG